MPLDSAHDVGQLLLELDLVDREMWSEIWPEVNSKSADQTLAHLENNGLLTALQIDKIRRGDTAGYFLGRFMVMYKISAGTFARVYRGIDIRDGSTVAIKVLRGRHAIDPESVRQFHREAKLTEQLIHPNLVRTLEVGTDDDTGQHYIAMEFVEGGNLKELLRIRGTFPPKEVVRLGIQMVEGLAHALKIGITHRDIKPTNILFTTEGVIKWVDFGLAGVAEGRTAAMMIQKVDDQQQRTVDYAGLERATGAPKGDPRSDIFFLGNVFFMMLTGESAIPESRDRSERMSLSRFRNVRRLADRSEIPRPVANLVDRMLAFSPSERFQNYDDLLRDLRGVEALLNRMGDGPIADNAEILPGFPPGKPRVMFVHRQTRIHDDIKDKLERRGYSTICNADLGRALMLHDIRPFHCLVIDLPTTGKEGVKAYVKAKRKAQEKKLQMAGIFLAADAEQQKWTHDLNVDLTETLYGQPVTLTEVRRALARLLPGIDKEDPADGA